MPHFRVSDDAHSHPKAIMAGDAAWGMWNRAGCWSMGYGTDGFVPDWWVKQQTQGATKAKRLVAAQLWSPGEYQGNRPEYRGHKGFNFHEWRQDSYEKVEADREKWRLKKEKQRATSPGVSPGDTTGDTNSVETLKSPKNSTKNGQKSESNTAKNSTPESATTSTDNPMSPRDSRESPGYIPNTLYPIENSGYVSESATDSNGRGGIAATPGAEIVNQLVSREHSDSVRTALRIRASELIRQGHPRADVAASVELWLTKPSLGPNALPSLLSEVIKTRAAPNGGHGQPTSKLRTIAELAARERALENAHAATGTKELE